MRDAVDFETLVGSFLDECQYLRGLTPKTCLGYRKCLAQFKYYWKDLPNADKAFEQAVERAIMAMMKSGLKRVSAASYSGIVSSFGNWLHLKGYRAAPYQKLKIRFPKTLPDFLTQEEYMKLLAVEVTTLSMTRAKLACYVMLDLGLRLAEALDLKPGDVGDEFVLIHGKGSKDRSVPISPAILERVRGYAAAHPAPYIFATKNGKKMGDRNLLRELKELAKAAGVERRMYVHLLRHSFATHFLKGGGNIKVLSEMLGHADLQVTSRYVGNDNQMMRADHRKASPMAGL